MPPLTMMIKPVSGACNMRCQYCFYEDVAAHREECSLGRMDLKTLECLVRKALIYAEDSCCFAFQGGEPTLIGADFYRELLLLERRYNTRKLPIMNSLQTNAYDLNDELIALLKEGNFLVGVSLDGSRILHDEYRRDIQGNSTYDRILENLRRLKIAGVEVNILTVVTEQLAERPREVWDVLKEYGYLQFIPCIEGFDENTARPYTLSPRSYGVFLTRMFQWYARALRKNRYVSVRTFDNYLDILLGREPESCAQRGQCGTYFLIEADGGVYPCDFYVLDPWRMGNIREASLYRLARSPLGEKFRAESGTLSGECKACKWFFLCRGGCKRDREPLSTDNKTRWCESYRYFFENEYPHMKELAEIVANRSFTAGGP